MSQKDRMAATLTKAEAMKQGLLDADGVRSQRTQNSRKIYGFTRRVIPANMPTEPKIYICSTSVYGDERVYLGTGFPLFAVEPCPVGEAYGPPCIIEPIYFQEEAKVDVTELNPHSGNQVAEAIMRIGAGMNAANDRRKIGWLMTDHWPPSQDELDEAEQIFVRECQRLLKEGNNFFASGKLNEINETHRRAAEKLHQSVDWDKPLQKMAQCIGCLENIKVGTIVHAVPYCGAVQPGKWPDAILNGMKDIRSAPPEIQEEFERKHQRRVQVHNPGQTSQQEQQKPHNQQPIK